MSNWIKCSERLPPISEEVLIYTQDGKGDYEITLDHLLKFDGKSPQWVSNLSGYNEQWKITHWMHKPEPPKN